MSTGKDIQNKKVKEDILTTEKNRTPKDNLNYQWMKHICISSDDEEESCEEKYFRILVPNEKPIIIVDDDNEDIYTTEQPQTTATSNKEKDPITANDERDTGTGEKAVKQVDDLISTKEQKESTPPAGTNDSSSQILNMFSHTYFLETAKTNIANMTREDLEKISLQEIRKSVVVENKLKLMAQDIARSGLHTTVLAKLYRDILHILKSIQEGKKMEMMDTAIPPIQITRSIGTQVFLERAGERLKSLAQLQNSNNNNVADQPIVRNVTTSTQSPQQQTPPQETNNQPISVSSLVRANNPVSPSTVPSKVNQYPPSKTRSSMIEINNLFSSEKVAEKTQHKRIFPTIDLTDDEPPAKISNQTSPAPPVGLITSQNLMATPQQQVPSTVSSPSEMAIPIIGPQSQNTEPELCSILKKVALLPLKKISLSSPMEKMPQNAIKIYRLQTERHSTPLLDAMKIPNQELPPSLDLKYIKEKKTIIISWKIERGQKINCEQIELQMIFHKETLPPECRIVDKIKLCFKSHQLPLKLNLQSLATGFKYRFAMTAVDINNRVDPMSTILNVLLNNN